MARTLVPITSVADCAAFAGVTSDAELGRLEMIWKAVEAEIRRFCGQNIAQPGDPYIDYLPHKDRYVPVPPLLQQDTAWDESYSYLNTGGPTFDGHILSLSQGLVRSVSDVRIDLSSLAGNSVSDFPSDTALDSTEYYLDLDQEDPSGAKISWSGNIIKVSGNWPTRRRTVKVTYVAGLTGAELDDEFSDIRLAVVQEVVDRYKTVTSGGVGRVKSEQLGDWRVTYELGETDEGSLSVRLRTMLQPYVRYNL